MRGAVNDRNFIPDITIKTIKPLFAFLTFWKHL
nr:MAG TPA: hypothetical protein [Caudoviricetes sp.]